MSIKSLLFPQQSRGFKGKHWLDVLLRTIHLIGLLGLAIPIIVQQSSLSHEQIASIYDLSQVYYLLTLGSGLSMVAISIWSNGKWLLQNRGVSILLKLVFVALLPFFPDYQLALLIIIMIISGVSSHAPARFRYYSPILGKEI